MPGLGMYLAGLPEMTEEVSTCALEHISLHLPSSFPPDQHALICTADIPLIEDQLQHLRP